MRKLAFMSFNYFQWHRPENVAVPVAPADVLIRLHHSHRRAGTDRALARNQRFEVTGRDCCHSVRLAAGTTDSLLRCWSPRRRGSCRPSARRLWPGGVRGWPTASANPRRHRALARHVCAPCHGGAVGLPARAVLHRRPRWRSRSSIRRASSPGRSHNSRRPTPRRCRRASTRAVAEAGGNRHHAGKPGRHGRLTTCVFHLSFARCRRLSGLSCDWPPPRQNHDGVGVRRNGRLAERWPPRQATVPSLLSARL